MPADGRADGAGSLESTGELRKFERSSGEFSWASFFGKKSGVVFHIAMENPGKNGVLFNIAMEPSGYLT